MNTLELHLPPKRFEPVFSGTQTAVYADMTNPAVAGNHLLIQEHAGVQFTGRWIRLQITHVEQTTNHSQVLSVRTLARSTSQTVRRRAA